MARQHTPDGMIETVLGPRRPMQDPAIVVEGLTVAFGTREILRDVSFEVARGETLAIMGLSGVGKSTTLRCLVGLLKPTGGRVLVDGRNVAELSARQLRDLRRRVGMAFQMPALFDSLTVGENVAFGLREHARLGEADLQRLVAEKLVIVGLEGMEHLYPSQLSGGQQKRASFARTIATDPDVILYDEPTTGLDPIIARVINELMLELQRRLGATSIVVTHDVEGALLVAHRVALLHRGEIVWIGPREDFARTDDPFVVQFREGRVEGPIHV